jgi:hypothetical protein
MVCGKGSFKSGEIFLDQRVPNRRRIRNTFGFSFRRVERSALCFRGSRSVNRDCRGLAAARPISAMLESASQPSNESSAFTENATTESPWPISSSTDAKYNNPSRPDCNLRIPLWRLVRASTAVRCFSHLKCCCGIAVIPPRRLCS